MARVVSASDCSEVVDGIALIVAMAVDPSVAASLAGLPDAVASPSATEPRAPGTVPGAPPPPAPAPTPSTQTARPVPPLAAGPVPPPPWRSAIGLGPAAVHGAGPGVAPGLVVWLLGEAVQASPWDVAALLALELASQGEVAVPIEGDGVMLEAAATFVRALGRLGGCPVRWAPAPSVGIRPCVTFEVGALRGSGSDDIRASQTRTAWWVAPGALVRGELALGRFLLVLDGLASVPLKNDNFLFSPDTLIFTIPPVAFGASLCVGLTFL